MARTVDPDKRRELLDQVVVYLAENGVAQATLRPMAAALGVSTNRLVHHFGTKEQLVETALARVVEQHMEVQRAWLRASPDLTVVEVYRKWWKWMNAAPANLASVRLGYEAAAIESTISGVSGAVRADQIGVWRSDVEQRMSSAGVGSAEAKVLAVIAKATFTGFVLDLVATGEPRRLTAAFNRWLDTLNAEIAERARQTPARRATPDRSAHNGDQ